MRKMSSIFWSQMPKSIWEQHPFPFDWKHPTLQKKKKLLKTIANAESIKLRCDMKERKKERTKNENKQKAKKKKIRRQFLTQLLLYPTQANMDCLIKVLQKNWNKFSTFSMTCRTPFLLVSCQTFFQRIWAQPNILINHFQLKCFKILHKMIMIILIRNALL